MTQSQSEQSLRQTLSDIFANEMSQRNGWPDPYPIRVTFALANTISWLSSRLEEMESRLSALELGSKQQKSRLDLIESRITLLQGRFRF